MRSNKQKMRMANRQTESDVPMISYYNLQVNYNDNAPTSFYSLIESLLYGGHIKGWVKPEKVHTHAVLLVLVTSNLSCLSYCLSQAVYYRTMTLAYDQFVLTLQYKI